MLERIESTMAAIKTKLLYDKTIRQLLFYDSNDALKIEAPERRKVEKYITLKPVFEFENREDYDQNSMINIYTTELEMFEESKMLAGIIQINVVCSEGVWDLQDDKIRPLQFANRIIELLHNSKFNVSNTLQFTTLTDLIINKKIFGYALLFRIVDGSGDIEKF